MKKIMHILVFLFSFFILGLAQDPVRVALEEHKLQLFSQALLKPRSAQLVAAQNEIDAIYYAIYIEVDYTNSRIEGQVSARFRSLTDNLQQVWLDLENSMLVESVSGAASSANHNQDVIEIELDRAYSAGEEFTVKIQYSGTPGNGGYSYFQFDQMPDGSPHIWTLSEPYGAKYWWPCKDTPADKADSADIFITIPDDQLAASNGTLMSETDNDDGTKTFHWHEQYPIATYLISLAIGNYQQFQEYYHYSDTDSMLLDYYVYPGELDNARLAFAGMHDYLDALSYYFGPYPFLEEKYGMARYNRSGGMEHQTLTSIGRVGKNWVWLYVHELGHQWFGDAVTCASWTDIWLNEGFASYSEALYAEWAGYNELPAGFEAYQEYMFSQFYVDDRTIFVADTSLVANIFNIVVYDKGSWVLHMLRHVLGDDVFFDVLKSYVSDLRWQYGSVSTADFQMVCEEKSGLDLTTFFEQWLYYPFFPKYSYSWNTVTSGVNNEFALVLEIIQQQTTTLYDMPIDVKIIFTDNSDTTIIVQNTQWKESYFLTVSKEPVKVKLDPDHWILSEVTPGSKYTYTAQIQIQNAYPNPFRETMHITLVDWAIEEPRLQVYNLRGRLVKNLRFESHDHPLYFFQWAGQNDQGNPVASGVYFIRVQSSNKSKDVRKIVYLK